MLVCNGTLRVSPLPQEGLAPAEEEALPGSAVQDIEFAQIEMKVIEGLKVGNDCLKKMHEVMSIEEVEKILDETQDAIEYQRQIDDMLAGALSQEDEDAVLAELEAITQEEGVALPEVPEEPLPELPKKGAEGERVMKQKKEMLAA
ncbi:hypothetical protein Z043_103378 [Scleropages formosus]|uniref:Charged multivesicular body protein 6-like n=1 Tax=Scleropages formosus TaxID=113540 RepID=A0A0P7US09_SCLFO|nr:hypothetical protein Z043_103378 [Scleropages formosus]